MQLIGYAKINSTGEEDDTFHSFPNPITLSTGDVIYGASLGEELPDGSKIVEIIKEDNSPGEWYQKLRDEKTYDGTKVIITVIYSAEPDLVEMRARMNCTPFQGRIALSNAGKLAEVQAIIDNADEKTKTAWEYALIWQRTSPMIETLMSALGLSDTETDDLFKAAQQIEA